MNATSDRSQHLRSRPPHLYTADGAYGLNLAHTPVWLRDSHQIRTPVYIYYFALLKSSGGSGQIGCSPLTLRVLDRLDGEYIVSPWRLEPGALIWFTLIEISLPFRHVHMSKLSFIWCTQDLVPDSSEGCVKSPLVCFAA
jgi:hypothetical protein